MPTAPPPVSARSASVRNHLPSALHRAPPLVDSDYMKKRGGSAPARIGLPLCSPPRPRTDRAPPSIAQTSTTRRGRRGRPARIRSPPPADTIPRGLLERCPRPRHARTSTPVLVLPRAPAQAYPTAYSPQRRPPHTDVASTSTRRRCVRFRLHRALPPTDRDDTTGPKRRREGQRLHAHDSSRFDVLARLRVRLLLLAPTSRTGPKRRRRAGASTRTSARTRSSRPCLHSALHSVLPLDDDRPLRAEEDGRRLRRAHGRWTMTGDEMVDPQRDGRVGRAVAIEYRATTMGEGARVVEKSRVGWWSSPR
jgi:hypothetical protein